MAVKARAEVTLSSVTDVKAVYRYYLLQSSTLAKPAKPTQNPPGGSWDDTEPGYTSGSTNSLYVVDLTVFSDDTFQYSDVSLSSSYEAAKAAYNKAAAAQNTANSAQNSIDNLQVGGRNLLLNTKAFGVSSGTSSILEDTYNDFSVRYLDTTSLSTSSYKALSQWENIYPEKLGQIYIFSFYAKGNGTLTCYFYGATGYVKCARNESSQGVIAIAGDGNTPIRLSDTWERYWVRWTLADNGDITIPKHVLLRLFGGNAAYVCGAKLELGNTATDWTPAPEDMETELEEVKEAAQKAQSIANGKNTVYYSTTQPTGSLKAGDIWFNTSDGGINFYNGSEWVTHQIGTVSIKDGAITADMILASDVFTRSITASQMTLTAPDNPECAAYWTTWGEWCIEGSSYVDGDIYAYDFECGRDIYLDQDSCGVRVNTESTSTASSSGWLLRGHIVSDTFCCNLGNTSDDTRLYGKNLYRSGTSTSISSDRRMKKDFTDLDQRYENFYKALKPCQFRFLDNTSERLHTGFIAQEVEEALGEAGIATKNFAGLVIDSLDEDALTEQGFDVNSEEWADKKQYYLRYEEFIALNTHMIQKLQAKVEELEKRLSESEKE